MSDVDDVAEAILDTDEAQRNGIAWSECRAFAAAALKAIDPPDRMFIDDYGRRWEWCGGVPETWAWRVTSLNP